MRHAAWLLAAGLSAAALAVTSGACGGDDDGQAAVQASAFGEATPVRRFSCRDWNEADPALRQATVEKIRSFAGGPITGEGVSGRGNVLEDEHAHRLFNRACKPPYARAFVLYKLYTHAAAFAGAAP